MTHLSFEMSFKTTSEIILAFSNAIVSAMEVEKLFYNLNIQKYI